MSGSTVGTAIGFVAGFFLPGGPQVWATIGAAIGGYVDPVKVKGPRLSDAMQQTSQEGIPIPFGYGTFPTAGNVIWAAVLVETAKKSGGKGGPQTTTYSYTRSYAIGICEGEISGLQQIKRNGKVVYDISPTSTTQGQNAKFIAKCTIYTGSETQLVSPVIEAVVGVGNTAPYRGLAYIVMENDDLTDTQGAIAQYEFVVQKCGTLTTTVAPTPVAWWKLDETSGTVATDSSGNGYHGTYIGGAVHATAITANSTGSMQLTNSGMGVTVPYNAALNVGTLDTDWSICASFKPESTAVNGSFHTLIANFASENFGTTNFRLNLANTATIEPSFSFNDTLGTYTGVSSPTATTVNTSHRLWGVRSGTNMYIYMDGALVATSIGAGTSTSLGANQGIHIGCGTLYPDSYDFKGRLSDVAVYSTAVSAAQIAADASHYSTLPGTMRVPDAAGISIDRDGNLLTGFAGATSITACSATLSDIVSNLCTRAGLTAGEVDVTALTDTVSGYKCATEAGAQSFIDPLMQAYFFDRGEWDKKIRFVKRGGASVASLTMDDLVARAGPAIEQTRVQEVELLRKVNVLTIDPAAQYNVTKQTWERRAGTVQAKGESSVELPIVMTTATAAQVAEKRGKVAWAETDKFKFALSRQYSKLTPTDIVTLTDAGSLSHRIRLTEQKEDGGIFEIEEAVKDRASTYGSTATGIANTNVPVNAAGLIGPTLFAAMNLPQLRTQDNSQGMYIGAAGILTGWPGATILMSVDGGASYDTVLTCLEPTIMGTLTADITATGTPLSVHVFGGSLASATAAQVLTGLNASAIITSNVSEIVAYETATATATGYYNLTVLTRFMKATVAVAHVSGDQFIDLNTAYFLPINSNLAGTTLYFKAVGIGLSADSVTAVTYVYNPYELPGEHQRIDGNGDLRIDANSDQRITA